MIHHQGQHTCTVFVQCSNHFPLPLVHIGFTQHVLIITHVCEKYKQDYRGSELGKKGSTQVEDFRILATIVFSCSKLSYNVFERFRSYQCDYGYFNICVDLTMPRYIRVLVCIYIYNIRFYIYDNVQGMYPYDVNVYLRMCV